MKIVDMRPLRLANRGHKDEPMHFKETRKAESIRGIHA